MDSWGAVWIALQSISLADGRYFLRGDVVSGRLSIDELMRLADMGAVAQIDADGRGLVRQPGQPVFRTVGVLLPRPPVSPPVSPPESPTPEEAERRWWQRTHEIDRGQLRSEAQEAAMWREARRLALQELGMTEADFTPPLSQPNPFGNPKPGVTTTKGADLIYTEYR